MSSFAKTIVGLNQFQRIYCKKPKGDKEVEDFLEGRRQCTTKGEGNSRSPKDIGARNGGDCKNDVHEINVPSNMGTPKKKTTVPNKYISQVGKGSSLQKLMRSGIPDCKKGFAGETCCPCSHSQKR